MISNIGVNLFYEYSQRGPGKVAANLIKGLKELQINCTSNSSESTGYCGLLQSVQNVHDKKLYSALCGPNLFTLPLEWGEECKNYKHFITPSKWVHNLYRQFSELDHATIDIWPVGIDTNFWKKDTNSDEKRCLIYFKHRLDEELSQIISTLSKSGINYEVLKYGHYTEQELMESCIRCSFAILLTGTESQGIGYMEILSMGLPCYVINTNVWSDNHGHKADATSVPYFDNKCGIIMDNLARLDEFAQSLNTYDPRSFICNNFTLSKMSSDYYCLLEKYNCLEESNGS